MTVTVRALTKPVGAEVSRVDLRRLGDADFAALSKAWTDHAMLLERGQTLSDAPRRTSGARFGELGPPPTEEVGRISQRGYPDVSAVPNVLDAQGEPIGALGAGEAVWHPDMSYLDLPPDASMVYALEIPPSGGNT